MKNEKVFNTVFELTCDVEEYKDLLEMLIKRAQRNITTGDESSQSFFWTGKISAYTEAITLLTQIINELKKVQLQALH